MNILLVCQHYWPEPFNTADVGETIAKHGCKVTVLTGLSNTGMPGNKILQEFKSSKALRHQMRNGVEIARSRLLPKKSGAMNRILNNVTVPPGLSHLRDGITSRGARISFVYRLAGNRR